MVKEIKVHFGTKTPKEQAMEYLYADDQNWKDDESYPSELVKRAIDIALKEQLRLFGTFEEGVSQQKEEELEFLKNKVRHRCIRTKSEPCKICERIKQLEGGNE